MQWIWSFEQLAKVCLYKKGAPERRQWALERVSTLYPQQATKVVLELIRRGDDESFKQSMRFLVKSSDRSFVQEIREFYLKSDSNMTELTAVLLGEWKDPQLPALFKQKFDGPVAQMLEKDPAGFTMSLIKLTAFDLPEVNDLIIESFAALQDHHKKFASRLFHAVLLAGPDPLPLWEKYFSREDAAAFHQQFVVSICTACELKGNYKEIRQMIEIVTQNAAKKGNEENPDVHDHAHDHAHDDDLLPTLLRQSADLIKQSSMWKSDIDLSQLLQEANYTAAATAIGAAVAGLEIDKINSLGETQYRLWLNRTKGRPVVHLRCLKMLAELFHRFPDTFKADVAFVMFFLILDVLGCEEVVGMDMEQLDPQRQWEFFLQRRPNMVWDDSVIDRFLQADHREQKVEDCFKALEDDVNTPAAFRILHFLKEINDPVNAERLLQKDFIDPDIWGDLVFLLLNLGPDTAFQLAAPIATSSNLADKRFGCALSVLADLPSDDTVQLMLDHWDELWALNSSFFLMILSNIADKRFLKPLKAEVQEYRVMEWQTYGAVCMINGVKDPFINQFEKLLQLNKSHETQLSKMVMDGRFLELLHLPVRLELQCRSCSRTYHYDVDDIGFCPETMDLFIGTPVTCRRCSTVDHYRLTESVKPAVLTLFYALAQLKEPPEDVEKLVLRVVKGIECDGGITPLSDIEADYRKKLLENPQDPALLVGYANTLRTIKRSKDAVLYFKQALECDPLCIDALMGLAINEYLYGNVNGTYDYFTQVAEILHSGNLYKAEQDREEFIQSFASEFHHLSKRVKKTLRTKVS